MKMVSAAKLNGLQRNLSVVRDFAAPITEAWKVTPVAGTTFATRALCLITSDRGLCGSMNSALNRQAKRVLLEANIQKKSSPPYTLIPLGNKGKNGLDRAYGRFFSWHLNEYGKLKTLQFRAVAIIADRLISDNHDEYTFLYNRFKNLISSEQKEEKMYSAKLATENSTALQSKFDIESGGYRDVLRDLAEFRFAVRLWQMFNENMTTEMSSRMNAMQNSSKAAAEMLNALTMQYNRTRQAKITTELIEIVSGAVAIESLRSD
jgi:F-type H+-transporting ATPase subunit gamma